MQFEEKSLLGSVEADFLAKADVSACAKAKASGSVGARAGVAGGVGKVLGFLGAEVSASASASSEACANSDIGANAKVASDLSQVIKFNVPVGALMASEAYLEFSTQYEFGASGKRISRAEASCTAYKASVDILALTCL